MSFKVFMPGALSATEWSQAGWRLGEPVDEAEHKLITPVLRRHLPAGGLVVDAGCGAGKWVAYLHRLGYRIIGLDVSAEALAAARRDAPLAGLALADTQRAPIRDGAVDAVLSLGVVEHDERGPVAGLRELHRIIKPGGVLVLDVPFNNWFRRLVTNPIASRETRRRRRAGWTLGFAEYRFDLGELRRFLEETGFEVVTAYPDDLRPPYNIGLWVDLHNIRFNLYEPPRSDGMFRLDGLSGTAMALAMKWVPWFVCGEVTVIAGARAGKPPAAQRPSADSSVLQFEVVST
jgi:SAM-dependent methyltransferase